MLVNVLDKAYIRCGLCQSIFPEVFVSEASVQIFGI